MTAKEHRRVLHRLAEEGFCEFETKKYVLNALKPLGCEVYEIGETGGADAVYFAQRAFRQGALRKISMTTQ